MKKREKSPKVENGLLSMNSGWALRWKFFRESSQSLPCLWSSEQKSCQMLSVPFLRPFWVAVPLFSPFWPLQKLLLSLFALALFGKTRDCFGYILLFLLHWHVHSNRACAERRRRHVRFRSGFWPDITCFPRVGSGPILVQSVGWLMEHGRA